MCVSLTLAGAYAHHNVALRLLAGERYLLLGKNGCGKSTLLRAIASGALKTLAEEEIEDKKLHAKREKIKGHPTVYNIVSTFLVDQELTMELERSVLETVLASDHASAALEEEASVLEEAISLGEEDDDGLGRSQSDISARLCEIYEELEALGGEDEKLKAAHTLFIPYARA